MDSKTIQSRLEDLRREYKTAAGVDKEIIRIRGTMLKIALEKRRKKQLEMI